MGQEYALEWLDQMVNELNPRRTEPENLDNDQSIAIVEKAGKEEKRLIRLFKHLVFQEQKNRQIRKSVNHYLSASMNLMRSASDNFNLKAFLSFSAASSSIGRAIHAYNNLRPHASIGYLTLNQAHRRSGPLPLKWYSYKKVQFGNIQYGAHF